MTFPIMEASNVMFGGALVRAFMVLVLITIAHGEEEYSEHYGTLAQAKACFLKHGQGKRS